MLHTASDWKSFCAAQMYLFLMIVPAYFVVDNTDELKYLFEDVSEPEAIDKAGKPEK